MMIKKCLYLLGLFFVFVLNLNAQNNSGVLFQIGDEKVNADEFWAIYQKNNNINQQNEKTSLKDYVDLYINFKLKVKEATDAKLDTTAAFIKELSGYRKQLAKPYLVNEEVNEEMLKLAYDRMLTDIRASHILFRLSENPLPKDTLATYQKALQIREAIMDGKLSFADAAVKYSEDPSARDMDIGNGRPPRPGNKGDLGYFSVFDMVYPFEEAAFQLKKGEISNPVRTRFGYHLIYITDKIPAIGEAKAAHIFIQNNSSSLVDSAKLRIDELYAQIKQGKAFEDLVLNYSDDKGTSEKGGELPWFTVNRMVPEFIAAISKMKPGEISQPVKTIYGWHIIKFLDQKPVADFDKVKDEIKEKLKRDIRSEKGKQAKIEQIKSEDHFQEFPDQVKEAIALINEKFYTPGFDIKQLSGYSKTLFTIGDRNFSQYDFLTQFNAQKAQKKPENFPAFVQKAYKDYADQMCLNYEDEHLEQKYFDFRLIMNEYREGILLFDLMDKKVWTKASSDSLGLEKYFKENQKKYEWEKRAELSVFQLNDTGYFKQLQNMLENGKSDEEIIQEEKQDTLSVLQLKHLTLEKDQENPYNELKWKKNAFYPVFDEKGQLKEVVVFRNILPPTDKKLNETRGLVISDYQDYLEKEWISELKKRYEVKVNKKVLRSLIERDKQ